MNKDSDSQQNLPLNGVKILDFTRVLSGPWSTLELADLGAEVWKIESVKGGDDARAWTTPSWKGMSAYFICANRGKKSIALDLKSDEGLEIVRELTKKADVVVENFRPGTMARLNIGYDDLSTINPEIIFCSLSGFGQSGTASSRPGYDFIMQAETGFMSITGEADAPPSRLGVAFTDVIAGMKTTQSILAALYQRTATGKGQQIDISMYETSLNTLANVGAAYLNGGYEFERIGHAHPSICPYQLFEASDGYFALAVGNDRMFRDFCHFVIERPDLAEHEDYLTTPLRVKHREILVPLLEKILEQQPRSYWLERCLKHGVPAGEMNTVAQALESDIVKEKELVQTLEHPQLGPLKILKPANGFAAQRGSEPTAPPLLGADTHAVLSEQLGYSPNEIQALAVSGVINQLDS